MEREGEEESIEKSYLELLGGGDFLMVNKEVRIEVEEGFLFSSPSPHTSTTCPQMLHFGGVSAYEHSSISPPPSTRKTKAKTSRTRGNGIGGGRSRKIDASISKETTSKKPKAQGTTKVRKGKVGDKINSLQQLVSSYGKTDTATVLHEALGYIRFLHDQVQVLSSPYMQSLPSSAHHEGDGVKECMNLRSRGLCLVPVSCTETMAAEDKNGADMWSPPAVRGSSTSSTPGSKH